ncbi:MAG: acyl carrier protein [bacterium]
MNLQRSHIFQIVLESVVNHSGITPNELNDDTRLIGNGRILDSIGLVSMLVELESRLAEETNLPIRLMDDRAMSQSKSPFRTAGTLADYIFSLLPD